MKSLSFALRSAITVTSVTFAFFLTLIYLEDYIIFNPTSSFYVKFIGPEIYLGRLLISAALSFSNGLITFIFITSFNNRLIEFSRMILDWARKTSSEYDLLSNSGYREINDIKEVFRSSIHAVKARETQNFNSIIKENNKVLIEQILENMYSIEKVPLKGIDIEFFPFRSRTYDNDLMNFIPTRNGCIVIITGFKKDNILTASYKARIQSIIEFTKSLSYTVEEELISAIQDSIRAFPIEHLNFTLAYFSRTSNLIKFLHFQDNPMYLYRKGKLEEVPVIGETQYPFMEFNSDLRMEKISEDTFFLMNSDRMLDRKVFSEDEFRILLKDEFSGKYFKSAKDFLEFYKDFIIKFYKQKGGTENVEDFLTTSVVFITPNKIKKES